MRAPKARAEFVLNARWSIDCLHVSKIYTGINMKKYFCPFR